MDTQFIPSEILNNVNIDMNNTKRLKELNDTFKEILKEENIKKLILEINSRIDSEMKLKKSKEYSLQKSKELEEAKKELQYLQSLVKN